MASVNFLKAFDFTMSPPAEGGFVLSTLKHDTGGQTYAGISREKQPQWSGWALIDAGDTTSDALKQMVQTFYYGRFWVRPNFEVLPQPIGLLAFDFAVNSGDVTAVKKLQLCIGFSGDQVDGRLGAATAARISTRDIKSLSLLYIMARLDYLDSLDAWAYFSKGWSNRIVSIGRAVAQ